MDSFFLKTSAPLSLMTSYRMSLISTGFISLDSTLNSKLCKATYTIFSVLYISVVVILHAFVLLHEGLQCFWHVLVAITSLVFPGCSAGKGSCLVTVGCCLVQRPMRRCCFGAGESGSKTALPWCGKIRHFGLFFPVFHGGSSRRRNSHENCGRHF
jgi:hypothetical protein